MIGRADIEGSKSDIAMNAWPPQASYPCGNFSDTSCLKLLKGQKDRIDRAFAARIRTENQDQASFCSFTLREVCVLAELALGHLRYHLTDVPPQSNSPPDTVLGQDRHWARTPTAGHRRLAPESLATDGPHRKQLGARISETLAHLGSQAPVLLHRVSRETIRVVVFHCRPGHKCQDLPPMLHL
ncbi:uncharacterized protein [Palaemon carinicauda]|uniref:uncharacterized protein n=1 Tax=Palaemon carinicauda TaxID=392227 RepID=UPI0035B5ECDE